MSVDKMKVITTDDILDYLEKHQPKTIPSATEIYTPNYSIYGVAPWWELSQAVCLLAGIATVDGETYYTLKSFDWLHEKIKISVDHPFLSINLNNIIKLISCLF